MEGTVQAEVRKMQHDLEERLLNTPDEELPSDELFLKRIIMNHINWRKARFNDDAEAVKNEKGEIIAYKGASFRSDVYLKDFVSLGYE